MIFQWQWWWEWQWDLSADKFWHSGRYAASKEPKCWVLVKCCQGSSLSTTPCSCSMWVLIILLGMSLHRLKATVRLCDRGVKGSGDQVAFFVSSADQRSRLRDRCDMEINMWVSRWCCQQKVSCLDHGIMFYKPHGIKSNCISLSHQFTDLLRQFHNNTLDQYELFWP